MAQNEDGYVRTHSLENIKQFLVYDDDGLLVTVYEARANAEDGDKCLRTDYSYVTGTTRIEKMRETVAAWDQAWDIA